jgi:hypothetical protein
MAITFNGVRNEASTGLSNEQFLSWVKLFGQAYELLFGESMEDRQNNSTGTSTFKRYADLIFLTLYSVKRGPTL